MLILCRRSTKVAMKASVLQKSRRPYPTGRPRVWRFPYQNQRQEIVPMKYCRLLTRHGAQYAEVVDRGGRLWVERLIPPFEEGPASDFIDPAADPFEPLPLDDAQTLS